MAVATAPTSATPDADPGTPLASSRTPRPPFQLTRRLVGATRWPLFLLTAIYALNVTDQYVVPTLFPLLKQEFGLSDSALGVLSSSYVIVVTLGTVPFGYFADRMRRTRVISWGTAAWGVTMIWTGAAWNYASLLVARMMLGAWDPCDNPTSQSLLADYYPKVQRSKVMSVYQTGQLLGILLVPISAAMATQWGWRSAFYFLSVPAFIVAILARRLPEPVRGQQDRLQQHLGARLNSPSKYDTMPAGQAYRELFRVRSFTLFAVSSTVGALFYGSIGTWSPTFFVRYHDMSISQAAAALSLLALGGLAGVLLSGWLADYLTFRGFRAGRVLIGGFARLISVPAVRVDVRDHQHADHARHVHASRRCASSLPRPHSTRHAPTCCTPGCAAEARRRTSSCRASARRSPPRSSASWPTPTAFGPRSSCSSR